MEKVRSSPELVAAQAHMKKKAGKEKRNIAGLPTKMLDEVASKQEHEETEEMIQCRSISQEVLMRCGKNCAAKWRRKSWRSTNLRKTT